MKLAYHGATSMKSDLATDVAVSSRAGFKALEVWADKVDTFLDSHSLSDLRALFRSHEIEPASINSIVFIAFRGQEYQAVLDRCSYLSSVAEYIGCTTLVVVPSPVPRPEGTAWSGLFVPWDDVVREYTSVLRDLGQIAKPHGVRLALEFLGFGWSTIRTPRAAAQIITEAAVENLGLNFDACHFYAGGASLNEIDALDPRRILTFHLNDVEDIPREAIDDSRRLLPGLGVIPLGEICERLERIGYDGLCSIELFRPEYWDWPPDDLARQARDSAIMVLSPYFRLE